MSVLDVATVAATLQVHHRGAHSSTDAHSAWAAWATCSCGQWRGPARPMAGQTIVAIEDRLVADHAQHVAEKVLEAGRPAGPALPAVAVASVAVHLFPPATDRPKVLTADTLVELSTWSTHRAAVPGGTGPLDAAVEGMVAAALEEVRGEVNRARTGG